MVVQSKRKCFDCCSYMVGTSWLVILLRLHSANFGLFISFQIGSFLLGLGTYWHITLPLSHWAHELCHSVLDFDSIICLAVVCETYLSGCICEALFFDERLIVAWNIHMDTHWFRPKSPRKDLICIAISLMDLVESFWLFRASKTDFFLKCLGLIQKFLKGMLYIQCFCLEDCTKVITSV